MFLIKTHTNIVHKLLFIKWDYSDSAQFSNEPIQNTSNDENVFMDNNDGNQDEYDTTIFIATFSANKKYVFKTKTRQNTSQSKAHYFLF